PQPLHWAARLSPSRTKQTLLQPPPHRFARLHGRHSARQPVQSLLPRADRPHGGRSLAQHALEAPARRARERAERVLARETVEPLGQQVVHASESPRTPVASRQSLRLSRPLRTQALTVPSGAPSASAISVCTMPRSPRRWARR